MTLSKLIADASFDPSTRELSFLDANGETISVVIIPSSSPDDPRKPLMFLSLQDGSTVKITNNVTSNSYEVSSDGESWTSYGLESVITLRPCFPA